MKKLNHLLADLIVLNQKLKTYHWNVKGDSARDAHKMTDKLYNGIIEYIDEVGEKIKMTGEYPTGTLKENIELSVIKEVKAKDFTAEEVIKKVVEDLSKIESTMLDIETDHLIQPLFDEIFLFIDKQRYLFGLLIKPATKK